MDILLNDYKRKLQIVSELIKNNRNNGGINAEKRAERLNTKAEEYRKIIIDIERTVEIVSSKNDTLLNEKIHSTAKRVWDDMSNNDTLTFNSFEEYFNYTFKN